MNETMTNNDLADETFYVLKELDTNQKYTQRDLSKKLGYSLGKVNFILKALIEKGLIKMDNFARNKRKLQYRYILTPQGLKQKYDITSSFIKRKEKEYQKLQKEIEEAKRVISVKEK